MPDTATRLWVAGILAGLALIGAIAFLVLGPGRFRPDPPSLQGDPVDGLGGLIAYADNEGCIRVVELVTGDEREIVCDANRAQALTFVDANTLVYAAFVGRPQPEWTSVDIRTGISNNLGSYPDPGWHFDPTLEGRIFVADDGEVFVEEDGRRRSIYDASFPDHHQPQPIALSPDGQWLMVFYRPPRDDDQHVWVIAMDGMAARTVTKDAGWDMRTVSWWMDEHGATPQIDHPPLAEAGTR